MSNFPKILLFFCHGESEATFVKSVIEYYIELKFIEIFGDSMSYYKLGDENPQIKIARDFEGKTYVSVNGFKENIKLLLEGVGEDQDIESECGIQSVTLIDIFEDENECENKRKNILENHEEIIKRIASDEGMQVNLVIEKSHLFYFEGSIENSLNKFNEINANRKGPKHSKIKNWADVKIKSSDDNLNTKYIKDLFTNEQKTNIINIFLLIDSWFESLNN